MGSVSVLGGEEGAVHWGKHLVGVSHHLTIHLAVNSQPLITPHTFDLNLIILLPSFSVILIFSASSFDMLFFSLVALIVLLVGIAGGLLCLVHGSLGNLTGQIPILGHVWVVLADHVVYKDAVLVN